MLSLTTKADHAGPPQYIADYVYARQTILFLCLGIFVLAVCRQWHIQTASKAHGSQKNFLLTPVKATKRVVALSRWMASRKLRIPHWSSMSLGQYLILSCFGLFLLRKGHSQLDWENSKSQLFNGSPNRHTPALLLAGADLGTLTTSCYARRMDGPGSAANFAVSLSFPAIKSLNSI